MTQHFPYPSLPRSLALEEGNLTPDVADYLRGVGSASRQLHGIITQASTPGLAAATSAPPLLWGWHRLLFCALLHTSTLLCCCCWFHLRSCAAAFSRPRINHGGAKIAALR